MPSATLAADLAGLGAVPNSSGTSFRVAAPDAPAVLLHLESPRGPAPRRLTPDGRGLFTSTVPGIGPGSLYRFEIEGRGVFPDPASRYQPLGVHGHSEVIDPSFRWTDSAWAGPDPEHLIIYELHVGTFTAPGTFRAAIEQLPALLDLGVTAIELMPLADFPGGRNWGYDPAALFAPARCYGRPEDLRALVNEAHRLGLAVLLDVVFNHLGPDGAYLPTFLPAFFSRAKSPWGQAVNLDGPGSEWVRGFFLESACSWTREFHLDGLRLDATHTLVDGNPRHLLADLADRVRATAARQGRRALVIAEDERNLDTIVRSPRQGGWGLDGVWADDFHHEVRRAVAGDSHGYYRDFTGSTRDIAETVRRGWFFCGQHSEHAGGPRGTDPSGIPLRQFVVCIQNHDQVGNRALGRRLSADVDVPTYLAATMLLLSAPETPLLFMGQEWAASSPFLYFTDHGEDLGRLVTEGRRREFRAFPEFAHEEARQRIPDPQASATFEASRLRWDEARREPHAGVRRFYAALLALRRPGGPLSSREGVTVAAPDDDTVVIARGSSRGPGDVVSVVRLRGRGRVRLQGVSGAMPEVLVSTEDRSYQSDAGSLSIEPDGAGWAVVFARPGGVVLRQ